MVEPQQVSHFLSFLTILAQVFVILVIILAVFYKKSKISKIISKNAILFSLIFAMTATLGSLYYSEIAGYEPCKLCWYQRIFMYPLVLILAIALYKKDSNIAKYVIAMCIIGIMIAFYHYLLQLGVVKASSCSAMAGAVSCEKKYTLNFGHITIPMMALTAFCAILACMIFKKKD